MSNPENDTENYEEEEDEELIALKNTKNQLLSEVCELREKLRDEERKHELEAYVNLSDSHSESVKSFSKNDSKRVQISERFFGAVSFENVNKKWLKDNIYEYKATIITKSLRLFIDLTVNIQDEDNYEILDINCHFLENQVDTYYFKEIEKWIDMFTKMKNFSFLISALVSYSEQSLIRAKILNKLDKMKYVTLEQCEEEGGGITVFVHSPKNMDKVHLKFQWATHFLEKTCRIEHFFIIEPALEGSRFIENNKELLNKFCRNIFGKTELEVLWSDLCSAIEEDDEMGS